MKKTILLFALTLSVLHVTAQTPINWTLVNTGTNKNIRDISFINKDTGFIAGDDGLLKITTNGGSTWSDLPIPLTGQGVGNNNNIKVAQFYNYGGAIAGVLFFDKFVSINRTYDLSSGWSEECGGTQFTNYDSVCTINNFHDMENYEQYAAGKSCVNGGGQIGWFGGFCFTFDSLISSPFYGGWNDITKAPNCNIVAVGENGYYASSTLFNPYVINNTGTGEALTSVDWSDTTIVYASNIGAWPLYKSTNGGLNFTIDSTILLSFAYETIMEIDFTDNDWGVMAGIANVDNGAILTKRGNAIDYFYADTPMTSVFVLDSTLAFAGGLNGMLFKYENEENVDIENNLAPIHFSVFPNPQQLENDVLNFFVEENVKEVYVYDIMGKVLLNRKLNAKGYISLSTGIQSSGTYIIKILTDKGVGTQKYIVN